MQIVESLGSSVTEHYASYSVYTALESSKSYPNIVYNHGKKFRKIIKPSFFKKDPLVKPFEQINTDKPLNKIQPRP